MFTLDVQHNGNINFANIIKTKVLEDH